MVDSTPPNISITSIENALESMIYSTSESASSVALQPLMIVDDFLNQPFVIPQAATIREYAVEKILSNLIDEQYQSLREIHGLSTIDGEQIKLQEAETYIAQDAQQGSILLIGWGYLYYQYLHPQLGISRRVYANICAVASRTLQRYCDHAIEDLHKKLIQLEWDARQHKHVQRLHAQVAIPDDIPLFGRQEEVNQLLSWLDDAGYRGRFIVRGATGVGKTHFISHIVHYLIDEHIVDHICSIPPSATLANITQALARTLGVTNVSSADFNELTLTNRVIMIVDGSEGKLTSSVWDGLSYFPHLLSLIEITELPTTNATIPTIHLAGIAKHHLPAFASWVQPEASKQNLQDMWYLTKGHPQRIQAYLQRERGLKTVAYADIYRSLPLAGQYLWWLGSIFYGRAAYYAEIEALDMWEEGWMTWQQSVLDFDSESRSLTITDLPFNAILWLRRQTLDAVFSRLLVYLQEQSPALVVPLLVHLWASEHRKNILHAIVDTWHQSLESSNWKGVTWELWDELIEKYESLLRTSLDGLWLSSIVKRKIGRWWQAQQIAEILIERSGEAGRFDVQAQACVELAILHRLQGEYAISQQYLKRADRMNRRYQSPHLDEQILVERIQAQLDTQNIHISSDDFDQITLPTLRIERAFLQRNFAQCRQSAQHALNQFFVSDERTAFLLSIVGQCYLQEKNLLEAINWLSGALVIAERLGQPYLIARAECNLGSAIAQLHSQTALEEAEILLKRAESRQQEIGDVIGLNGTHHNLRYVQKRKYHLDE